MSALMTEEETAMLDALGHSCDDCNSPACYRSCCFPPRDYGELYMALCHKHMQALRIALGTVDCAVCNRLQRQLEKHRMGQHS